MPYSEAMNRYGVDKPDTRFEMELTDFTDTFKQSQFKVFSSVANGGGSIKAINAKGLADITQGELKNLEDVAKTLGAKGLAFIKAENGAWKSPILKFLSEAEQAELKQKLNIEDGDIVFFAACEWERACSILGRIRLECAKLLQARGKLSIPADQFNFLWVIEFPLMLFDEEQGRYVSAHHPFTSPVEEDIKYLDSDPLRVRGQHYDIVLNGKKKTENKSQSDKKQEKGIDSDAVRKLVAAIGWKSVSVEGVIGFEQKPAKTALIASSSIMIFDLIHNTILSNCAEFVTNIVPDYERTRFELHVKIRQKFSLPLIIFMLLRILLQRRSK